WSLSEDEEISDLIADWLVKVVQDLRSTTVTTAHLYRSSLDRNISSQSIDFFEKHGDVSNYRLGEDYENTDEKITIEKQGYDETLESHKLKLNNYGERYLIVIESENDPNLIQSQNVDLSNESDDINLSNVIFHVLYPSNILDHKDTKSSFIKNEYETNGSDLKEKLYFYGPGKDKGEELSGQAKAVQSVALATSIAYSYSAPMIYLSTGLSMSCTRKAFDLEFFTGLSNVGTLFDQLSGESYKDRASSITSLMLNILVEDAPECALITIKSKIFKAALAAYNPVIALLYTAYKKADAVSSIALFTNQFEGYSEKFMVGFENYQESTIGINPSNQVMPLVAGRFDGSYLSTSKLQALDLPVNGEAYIGSCTPGDNNTCTVWNYLGSEDSSTTIEFEVECRSHPERNDEQVPCHSVQVRDLGTVNEEVLGTFRPKTSNDSAITFELDLKGRKEHQLQFRSIDSGRAEHVENVYLQIFPIWLNCRNLGFDEDGYSTYINELDDSEWEAHCSNNLLHDGSGESEYALTRFDSDTGEKLLEVSFINGIDQGIAVVYEYLTEVDRVTEVAHDGFIFDSNLALSVRHPDEPRELLADSRNDGELRVYYKSGNLLAEMTYENGLKEGSDIGYFESGQISDQANYVNGLRQGAFVIFYENGNAQEVSNYLDDRLHGKLFSYDEDGNLLFEHIYKNGEKDGEQIHYWENGNIKTVIHFVDGVKHGLQENYYSNGVKESSEPYVDGELHGVSYRYIESGTLLTETTWVAGVKNGPDIKYYANGQIEDFKTNVDGKFEGEARSYYYSGDLERLFHYSEGKLHGQETGYFQSGEISAQQYWEEGSRIGIQKLFYIDGTVKRIQDWTEEKYLKRLTLYYPNGYIEKHTERSSKDVVTIDYHCGWDNPLSEAIDYLGYSYSNQEGYTYGCSGDT
ncbi:toxin-antitoxin system YwqK family antitoxin, partial [Oleiphilus sp. HI0128]